jgi:hypothetical protein
VNDGGVRAALLVAAIALAIAAILADTNTDSAIPLAVAAGLALTGFAALSVVGRTRFVRAPFVPPVTDPLVALRNSFRSGALGRQRIAGAVLELQRETLGRSSGRPADPGAPRPEDLPPDKFRAWVSAQLDELERAT